MIHDKDGKALTGAQVFGKIVNRIKNIWLEFIVFKLHLTGCIPSHNFRKLIYRIFGIKIGKGSTIHMKARFYDPRNIVIGEDTIIGEGAVLDNIDKNIVI
jgi:maltose O-acetyltransferase